MDPTVQAPPSCFFRSWPCHAEPSSSAAAVLAKRRRSSAVPSVRRRPSQPQAASSAQHQAPQVRARRVQRCSRSSFCFSGKEQAPIKEPPITKPFPAQVKIVAHAQAEGMTGVASSSKRPPSLSRPMPWCAEPHCSAQISPACNLRWDFQATLSSR